MKERRSPTFQDILFQLRQYWEKHGCALLEPYDMAVGAATFHPATFLRALGDAPWRAAFAQPCRRPTDGRYGKNPNRGQQYFQFQVVLKPTPADIKMLFVGSLEALGIDKRAHDIRFIEDDWASPTLGAWGLGWEVWLNGMEICQFTYFQQIGGRECSPVTGEITYGLERIAMYLQEVDSMFDLVWTARNDQTLFYGDLYLENEIEMSKYNFEEADIGACESMFSGAEDDVQRLLDNEMPIPAYEAVLRASHAFNLLDARQAVSVNQRQQYILRIRRMASAVAEKWIEKTGNGLRNSR